MTSSRASARLRKITEPDLPAIAQLLTEGFSVDRQPVGCGGLQRPVRANMPNVQVRSTTVSSVDGEAALFDH
jgi:hypothetical protein